MKILLVSHGNMAAGMKSTLEEFFGVQEVYAACVTKEGGVADLSAKAEEYFAQWGDEQVVILSDLKGGSANQTAFLMLSRPNTFLVSGMNLSLALQLSMEDEVTAQDLHDMMEQAVEDMVLMNEINAGAMDEDDE